MADPKGWRQVRGQRPLNESRVATYRRLMEAQELIAAELARGGVDAERLAAALAAAGHPGTAERPPQEGGAEAPPQEGGAEAPPQEAPTEEVLYLWLLARYVAALGGRLELRAVFPEATVEIPELDAAGGRQPSA